MTPLVQRLQQLNGLKAEVDDYLGQAMTILAEPRDHETPTQMDRAHGLAGSYVRLAGAALERFDEVARG